ncbi:zinc finger protein 69 homolog [Plodia interpunctella]|uniref:zinc finger protein 69 homolog n=1 Tax=Plodia interpunctella TaxID=58824 RepID=UPI00236853C6|nr:zinc finger protein 69 homolog [Plodia interpunctella]XP_053602423.1 zinc finger protein 69 homolog [Plodia interpunctella]
MCDWLSSGDWCDVQLFCGGRSFNAHRAVLASASSFLKRILLSASVEETPTCIFLPDFDLETFSSVLFYIYNGEVAIQKHKLQSFIDVVKALDIFVDLQCLHRRNSIDNNKIYGNKYLLENTNSHKTSSVFSLDSGNNSDQYINIKKGEHNQDVHTQSWQDESDFHDNQARLKNWINPVLRPSSQILPTFHFDRQKNFFPRDLCLETCPRNGNTNGYSAGVHAISNESYRAPASVLLTNANGKPPREDDALSDVTRKTTGHNSYIGYKENLFPDYNNPNENYSKNGDSLSSVFSEEEVKDSWNNLSSFNAPTPSPQLSMGEQFLPEVPLPVNNQVIADPLHTASTMTGKKPGLYPLVENTNTQHPLYENTCLEANQQLTRASIYNQVLENPWCSRLTFNYRPTFKKMPSVIDDKEIEVELVNDNNNNSQQQELSSTEELPEKVLIAAEEAPVKVFTSNQDFKCIICSQVFPDSEGLKEHARQHSAGRHTCPECGKTFSQLRNFKYHMSVHRGTREFAATCTVCGKYFNDRGYLSSHMKIHRNRKEYKCSMCPKSFNQRVAYNMHVRIHTGVKPHVCSECGKAFSRKMLLKQHQRTHSGERPYACPHCDKRFADRSNMTLHLRLHSGVKPFSCSLCPKSFTKKHHLKSHLNFHTGAKPYSCPRCKLAFTQSSNMRTHYKKCNATEPVADTSSS